MSLNTQCHPQHNVTKCGEQKVALYRVLFAVVFVCHIDGNQHFGKKMLLAYPMSEVKTASFSEALLAYNKLHGVATNKTLI